MRFASCALVVLVFGISFAQDSSSHDAQGLQGSITQDHIYKNAALAMTVILPGVWELIPGNATKGPSDPSCRGLLCGAPEIDVTLQTKTPSSTRYRVFLAGYKVAPLYQDRHRYPLQRFAEVMLKGSMNGSGLTPIGSQEAIRLDGRLAYRQLAGHPGEQQVARAIGYVTDANGYVFLLVLATPSNPEPLKDAIEKMSLHSAQ